MNQSASCLVYQGYTACFNSQDTLEKAKLLHKRAHGGTRAGPNEKGRQQRGRAQEPLGWQAVLCCSVMVDTRLYVWVKTHRSAPCKAWILDFPGGTVHKNLPVSAETQVDPWSGKIPRAERQLSLCHNSRAHALRLPQPTHPRACAPRQKKPRQWEAHASNKDPKVKKWITTTTQWILPEANETTFN